MQQSCRTFSLRFLLIFIGIVGVVLVPCRWFVHIRTHVVQTDELERAFRARGWTHGYTARWYDEGVCINDSRFGDKQLLEIKDSLEKYTQATFLSFRGTQVTEEGIKLLDFSCFQKNIVVNVCDTQVSAGAARQLQQSLPGCRIVHESFQDQ